MSNLKHNKIYSEKLTYEMHYKTVLNNIAQIDIMKCGHIDSLKRIAYAGLTKCLRNFPSTLVDI